MATLAATWQLLSRPILHFNRCLVYIIGVYVCQPFFFWVWMCKGNRMTHAHAGFMPLIKFQAELCTWTCPALFDKEFAFHFLLVTSQFWCSCIKLDADGPKVSQLLCHSSSLSTSTARWSLWKVKATGWSVLTLQQTNHAGKLWRATNGPPMIARYCKNEATGAF